jgi:diaminopimelate epimerase
VRRICDRRYGAGADGLLVGPLDDEACDFRLRFYNPDGGEVEKSGNGLRIFARYLWDRGLVGGVPFTIATHGGAVTARVDPDGQRVRVDMGRVSFDSHQIPVAGPAREVLGETMVVDGRAFRYCAATVGNPHCVVLCEGVLAEDARRWGPFIEGDARFPNGTNVQFMEVLDEANIRIEIWERGAGYTLSSGSSSCASAAAAHRLGLCGPRVVVHAPGGAIDVEIKDRAVSMAGPVSKVCEGVLAGDLFR